MFCPRPRRRELPRRRLAAAGGGQYGGGGEKHSVLHNWTFEAGGGFNAPISNSVTYGGQFTVGAGLNFNKYLAALIEYQFIDDKLPGYLIAEAGAKGGYAHIWSFTIDPVIDLMPKATNDVYVTGGGGFYRKVTSFTDPEETSIAITSARLERQTPWSGTSRPIRAASTSARASSTGLGGMYGDSNTKLFVEARYLDVFSPAVMGSANGLGMTSVAANTRIIPVSVGVRF